MLLKFDSTTLDKTSVSEVTNCGVRSHARKVQFFLPTATGRPMPLAGRYGFERTRSTPRRWVDWRRGTPITVVSPLTRSHDHQ
jgi:hypothetical protein